MGIKKRLKKNFYKEDFLSSIKHDNKNKAQQAHFEALGAALPGSNINPLIVAAYPLFLLFMVLKKTTKVSDVDKLRNQLIEEIRNFERKTSRLGYDAKIILAARYCLCTMLDEGILGTKWGQASNWSQQCLLSIVHKETWGGERFYVILEEMAKDLDNNVDLLELLYLILTQGFEGKYYDNTYACNEIRSNLFQKLLDYRGETEQEPTLVIKSKDNNIGKKQAKISVFSVLLIVFAFLFIGTMLTNYNLKKQSVPIFQELNKI